MGVEAERLGRLVTVGMIAVKAVMAVSVAGLAFIPSGEAAPESVPAVAPASIVECWEDLACSDGSTLDSWDCARSTFTDERGRLVRSNGQCGPVRGGVFEYWESVLVCPDGSLPSYQDWLRGEGC